MQRRAASTNSDFVASSPSRVAAAFLKAIDCTLPARTGAHNQGLALRECNWVARWTHCPELGRVAGMARKCRFSGSFESFIHHAAREGDLVQPGSSSRDGPEVSLLRNFILLVLVAARSLSNSPCLNTSPPSLCSHARGTGRRCDGDSRPRIASGSGPRAQRHGPKGAARRLGASAPRRSGARRPSKFKKPRSRNILARLSDSLSPAQHLGVPRPKTRIRIDRGLVGPWLA